MCAGRDYIHQLAVLNVCTGQLLTARLRTCPRITGPQAAQVRGMPLAIVAVFGVA